MEHRKSLDEIAQYLESQKQSRLEEAQSFSEFSDSKLKQIIHEARTQQHSLTLGSMEEIKNTKSIELATLVLETRQISGPKQELNELSKDTLKSYVDSAAMATDSASYSAAKAFDAHQHKDHVKLVGKTEKRRHGVNAAIKRLVKEGLGVSEEAERVDELSKTKLGDYVVKSIADMSDHAYMAAKAINRGEHDKSMTSNKRTDKRLSGIMTDTKKLVKEDAADPLDEISSETLKNYNTKAWKQKAVSDTILDPDGDGAHISDDVFDKNVKIARNRSIGLARATVRKIFDNKKD